MLERLTAGRHDRLREALMPRSGPRRPSELPDRRAVECDEAVHPVPVGDLHADSVPAPVACIGRFTRRSYEFDEGTGTVRRCWSGSRSAVGRRGATYRKRRCRISPRRTAISFSTSVFGGGRSTGSAGRSSSCSPRARREAAREPSAERHVAQVIPKRGKIGDGLTTHATGGKRGRTSPAWRPGRSQEWVIPAAWGHAGHRRATWPPLSGTGTRAMPARLLLLCLLLRSSWLTAEGDGKAVSPRATVLLRRPTPLVSVAGPTRLRPRWNHGSRARSPPDHRIEPSSAHQALTLRPKLRTSEPGRSRKLSAGASTRSGWPPPTATWSLPIRAEGSGTRA